MTFGRHTLSAFFFCCVPSLAAVLKFRLSLCLPPSSVLRFVLQTYNTSHSIYTKPSENVCFALFSVSSCPLRVRTYCVAVPMFLKYIEKISHFNCASFNFYGICSMTSWIFKTSEESSRESMDRRRRMCKTTTMQCIRMGRRREK